MEKRRPLSEEEVRGRAPGGPTKRREEMAKHKKTCPYCFEKLGEKSWERFVRGEGKHGHGRCTPRGLRSGAATPLERSGRGRVQRGPGENREVK